MRSSKFPRTTNQDTLIHWAHYIPAHTPSTHLSLSPPPATSTLLIFTVPRSPFGQFETTICALHHLHEPLVHRMFIFIIPPPSRGRSTIWKCSSKVHYKKYTATRQPPDRLTSSLVRKNVLFILVIYRLPTASRLQVRFGGCLLSFPSNQSESSNRFRVNRSEAQLNQLDAINEGDVFRKCPSVNCFPFPVAFLFLTGCRA